MLGGRDAAAYAVHIQDPAVWGGGVDMRALAEHFGVQVAAVNVQTQGGVNVFCEDRPFMRRIYVIYDGLHFDALCRVSRTSGRPDVTVFAPSDDSALHEAVAGACERFQWGPIVLMLSPTLPLLPTVVQWQLRHACGTNSLTLRISPSAVSFVVTESRESRTSSHTLARQATRTLPSTGEGH